MAATAITASTVPTGRLLAESSPQPKGPVFHPGGPDSKRYGEADGYPVPPKALAISTGNPWPQHYRVGAFSHLDAIYPTRTIHHAAKPWLFKRADTDVSFTLAGQKTSLSTYLSSHPITGLLLLRDDTILFEHYQYGRKDTDRLLGQSMTKSMIGLLIGMAIADGLIKSVDDKTEMYVPGLKDTEYGRTPIRDLLHMSSGVDFGEDRDDGRDLNRLWMDMVLGSGFIKKGTLGSLKQFNRRIAPPGTKFHYASIEPDVLGLVLHHVLGKTLSSYLQEKLWQPMGAEADATWLTDAEGIEVGHFGFSAVLRDYARLARLLVCDGTWEGKQLIPANWLTEATTVRAADSHLAPGIATPTLGYGYLLWLLNGKRRQFALLGQNGQRICIDPASKLVLVHTSLENAPDIWKVWSALVEQLA